MFTACVDGSSCFLEVLVQHPTVVSNFLCILNVSAVDLKVAVIGVMSALSDDVLVKMAVSCSLESGNW